MSIESKIDALRESIEKLTEALGNQAVTTTTTPAPAPEPEVEKPKAKPAPEKAKAEPKPEKPKAKPAPEKAKPAKEVTLTTLATAFTKMMGEQGRDAGLELLNEYGAAKLSAIPKNAWGEVMEKIQARLEG